MLEDTIQAAAEATLREWADQKTPMSSRGPEDPADHLRRLLVRALLDERDELREKARKADMLAFGLGGDILNALEDAFVEGDLNSRNPWKALLYVARGWKRERANIGLYDCTEGQQVTVAVKDLPDGNDVADDWSPLNPKEATTDA
jgi:hypothetical protein